MNFKLSQSNLSNPFSEGVITTETSDETRSFTGQEVTDLSVVPAGV